MILATNCVAYDANHKLSSEIIVIANAERTVLFSLKTQKPSHNLLGSLTLAPNNVIIVIRYKTAPIITFAYVILANA